MCKLPHDATFTERLKHDFKNSYYQLTVAYIAFMLTVIAISVIFDAHI